MPELNYPEWKMRFRGELETFPGKSIMMFFSGGKDSSLVLHFLKQAARDFGFSFETHAAAFPHHVYTHGDRDTLDRYWNSRGITIDWHEIFEPDERLKEAMAENTSACLICNTAKKRTLIESIKSRGLNLNTLVVVLSYSLWDLVSACVEHMVGSVFASQGSSTTLRYKPAEERFHETSQRFYPLLQMPNGFTVFKPLIYYNDQDILEALGRERIPVLSTSCEFKHFRPKRNFSQYYERLGLTFDYDEVFNFAKTVLKIPDADFFNRMDGEYYLKKIL
ncbi:MAG: hypothetical protein R6V84_05695 [Desulfobacterales bacterium]